MLRSSRWLATAVAMVSLESWTLVSATDQEHNNWAVLVDTSRYWYNYRHVANTLTFYRAIKRLGIPDSRIILMLAEDVACNTRNPRPGTVFRDVGPRDDLYGEDVEVDYRGDEVSVDNFIRLLSGRHAAGTPRNKRLLTDSMSNVFIFITGHSGEEFIKFQDWEELSSSDIADALGQMHTQKRYRQIFWLADTCQAASLQNQFYSPGIIGMGSSGQSENSYSHHVDLTIGVSLIDRFTFWAAEFLKDFTPSSTKTLKDFHKSFTYQRLYSNPEMRSDLFYKKPEETLLTEFLATKGKMRFNSKFMVLRGLPEHGDGANNQRKRPLTAVDAAAVNGGSCPATAASAGACLADEVAPPTKARTTLAANSEADTGTLIGQVWAAIALAGKACVGRNGRVFNIMASEVPSPRVEFSSADILGASGPIDHIAGVGSFFACVVVALLANKLI
eukprot:TRINITY_DN21815_c0_g1_i1.p1 TRINITY_DN21815_c0_g1~~TRINITY_DN21815_c0_g1_i1.p1  ORF type:complete len:446 (-),score=64.02 TRINITY_DN21815_c0_g1_i1:40-1377(-)